MIDRLIPLWERALQRTGVRADDNFFDLGGTPETAKSLFAEIESLSGRTLPPFLLYHAPTPREMAAALDKRDLGDLPRVVPFKGGGEWPPIFIVPGLGADPNDFFKLVRRIETTHPILVLQAKGVDGTEEPLRRVEDIAQNYFAAILGIQPKGPYLFIGSSFGGVVTLELARLLAARGEGIGFFTMLESFPHFHYLKPGQRIIRFLRVATNHLKTSLVMPWKSGLGYAVARVRYKLMGGKGAGMRDPDSKTPPRSPVLQRLSAADYDALKHYHPIEYHGKVKFVRASIGAYFPRNPAAVWRPWIKNLEVETVSGDHNGITRKNYEELASVLTRYLKEAGL